MSVPVDPGSPIAVGDDRKGETVSELLNLYGNDKERLKKITRLIMLKNNNYLKVITSRCHNF